MRQLHTNAKRQRAGREQLTDNPFGLFFIQVIELWIPFCSETFYFFGGDPVTAVRFELLTYGTVFEELHNARPVYDSSCSIRHDRTEAKVAGQLPGR